MFKKITRLIFNKKEEIEEENYNVEEVGLNQYEEKYQGEITYREESKILIVSKKRNILDNDNIDWYRGIINFEKLKKYVDNTNINRGDLVEVAFKELIVNGDVVDRKVQSIKKLEGFSYNVKRCVSKVKNINEIGFAKFGIEFENGHTYAEFRFLQIGPSCPSEEEVQNIHGKKFGHKNDTFKEVYLEICKDGISTGDIITIRAEKVSDDVIYSTIDSINSREGVERLLEDREFNPSNRAIDDFFSVK